MAVVFREGDSVGVLAVPGGEEEGEGAGRSTTRKLRETHGSLHRFNFQNTIPILANRINLLNSLIHATPTVSLSIAHAISFN